MTELASSADDYGDDCEGDCRDDRQGDDENGRSAVSMIGNADEEPYEPGWLGVVLRWPIRVVAVSVIMPVQVVLESAKAATRAAVGGVRSLGRGARRLFGVLAGRPLRFVGRTVARGATAFAHGTSWVVDRAVRRPLRVVERGLAAVGQGVGWLLECAVVRPSRLLGRVGKWLWERVVVRPSRSLGRAIGWFAERIVLRSLRSVGRGISAAARAVGRFFGRLAAGFRVAATGLNRALMWFLRPLGRGAVFIDELIDRAVVVPVGRAVRQIGRVLRLVATQLVRPLILAVRGIWFVLKLFGGWIVGLAHVIAEAFIYGARVGQAIGRGVVWAWTRAVWHPVRSVVVGAWSGTKWLGRGLRTGWLTIWRPVRTAWKQVTGPIYHAVRGVGQSVRDLARRIRRWYRHEISDPIRSALRTARRDVRRALTGGRRQ